MGAFLAFLVFIEVEVPIIVPRLCLGLGGAGGGPRFRLILIKTSEIVLKSVLLFKYNLAD